MYKACTTVTPTHRYVHVHIWEPRNRKHDIDSYGVDKEIADADAQEKRFADVLIGEVLLLSLVLTCDGGDGKKNC